MHWLFGLAIVPLLIALLLLRKTRKAAPERDVAKRAIDSLRRWKSAGE